MKEDDTQSRLLSSAEKDEPHATLKIHGSLGKLSSGERFEAGRVSVPIKLGELLADLSRSLGLEVRRDSTLILVNGVEANALQDLETLVVDGDQVSLVPMFHGGVS
jgi:molybdopterin converting factor small subunit